MDERAVATLFRWPGGTLDTIRPIDIDEAQALASFLGTLSSQHSGDGAAVVQKHLGWALIRMLEIIAIGMGQKSIAAAENQANFWLPFYRPIPGSDAYVAGKKFAENQGISFDEFQARVAKTGRELVNSGTDGREKTLLNAFCSHVVGCADELLGKWTLPAKVEILDNSFEPGPGVLTFAKNALPVLCGHLRNEMPNAAGVIAELQKTNRISLFMALDKLRRLTMDQALQRMRSRISKLPAKAKNTAISVKTRK